MAKMAAFGRFLGHFPLVVILQLLISQVDSFSPSKVCSVRNNPSRKVASSPLHAAAGDICCGSAADVVSRRSLLQGSVASVLLSSPLLAQAATEKVAPSDDGLVSATRLADLLHVVPTFTLVDKKGAPFMVVGEDAKVTGYFFTEFTEAQRILKLADKSADKSIKEAKNDPKQKEAAADLKNPWKDARISTVPLDVAATIVTKSMYASAKGGGNYFQVAPSDADVEDALSIIGQDDLIEGKVPLFYFEDFTTNVNGDAKDPLYFRKGELEKAYKKENPGKDLPTVLVTELFAVVASMVAPGGTDNDLKKLAFVPPTESVQKAKECDKNNGKEAAFVIGQRNLVL